MRAVLTGTAGEIAATIVALQAARQVARLDVTTGRRPRWWLRRRPEQVRLEVCLGPEFPGQGPELSAQPRGSVQ